MLLDLLRSAEVLVTTSWTFVVENSYRLIQNVATNSTANIRIIRTVCSGMIHPNIIIDALTQGADGVLLCGCHPGNCRSREGIRKAQDRAEAIELLLEDFGLEPERFRLEHISASEGPKFARVVEQMTEELTALGPNPYGQTP